MGWRYATVSWLRGAVVGMVGGFNGQSQASPVSGADRIGQGVTRVLGAERTDGRCRTRASGADQGVRLFARSYWLLRGEKIQ